SRRRHTRWPRDWSSDVCSSDLYPSRFLLASRMLEIYGQSGIQAFVRSTGLLKRLAPQWAKAEALMPDINFESGVTLDSHHRAEEIGRASCRERVESVGEDGRLG